MKRLHGRCAICNHQDTREKLINYREFYMVICPKCAIELHGPEKYYKLLDQVGARALNLARLEWFKNYKL